MFMSTTFSNNSFIFHEQIDTQSISDLYGDDFPYIEEVFTTVLGEYEMLAANILSSYGRRDKAALKSAVHKIKPIFGFAGLTGTQHQFQLFENLCQDTTSFESLDEPFKSLQDSLLRSKLIITEEKKKLEVFNRDRS
jgi:hypothetical protein